MATPEGFGDRKHFEGDGCDRDSIRHAMALSGEALQKQIFRRPTMGVCQVVMYPDDPKQAPFKCGRPVEEEEFDCGRHGDTR